MFTAKALLLPRPMPPVSADYEPFSFAWAHIQYSRNLHASQHLSAPPLVEAPSGSVTRVPGSHTLVVGPSGGSQTPSEPNVTLSNYSPAPAGLPNPAA